MTLQIRLVKQFKKDLKRFLHQKDVLKDLEQAIATLEKEQMLPAKFRDHALIGNWMGYRECHIRGDLLLVYKICKQENVLFLVAFGSHAEVLDI